MVVSLLDNEAHNQLLRAASCAPTIHHTRPWRLRFHDAIIEVYRDPSQELSGGDPTPNGVLISIGMAVFNVRTAAAHLGYRAKVQILPDAERPLEAATLALSPCKPGELLSLAGLYGQLSRQASRVPRPRRRPTVPIRADLSTAAALEGAALEWISDPIRLGRLETLFPEAGDHSNIGVLSTARDLPADQIAAGFALQRIRLTAAGYGLAVAPPPHPVARYELRSLVRDPRRGWIEPQVLVRFGRERAPRSAASALEGFLLAGSG